MKLLVVDSYEEMSRKAAEIIAQAIAARSDAVLGLATGSTPCGTYEEMVRMYKRDEIDFSQVSTFNLDEYVGLPSNHPQSYHVYMDRNLFSHVNAKANQTHLPNGCALDLHKECTRYEQSIESAGGIDLQLLGIGANGHIGFNEPGSRRGGRTSVVELTKSTIQANSRFFDHPEDVPKQAITVGIGTILTYSKRIILLASGEEKAQAVANMLEEQPNEGNPASYLQNHDDVQVIIDKQAAKRL